MFFTLLCKWNICIWVWFFFTHRFCIVFPSVPEANQNDIFKPPFLLCTDKNGWYFCFVWCFSAGVNTCIHLLNKYIEWALMCGALLQSRRCSSCALAYSLFSGKCVWVTEEGNAHCQLCLWGFMVEGKLKWFLITRILIEFWDRAWYEEGCGGRKHKLFEEQGGN